LKYNNTDRKCEVIETVLVRSQPQIVYSGEYKEVSSIIKSDENAIRVMLSDNNSLLLKKEKQLGIISENME